MQVGQEGNRFTWREDAGLVLSLSTRLSKEMMLYDKRIEDGSVVI